MQTVVSIERRSKRYENLSSNYGFFYCSIYDMKLLNWRSNNSKNVTYFKRVVLCFKSNSYILLLVYDNVNLILDICFIHKNRYRRWQSFSTRLGSYKNPGQWTETWISVLTGFTARSDFWHFSYHWKYQKMILLSFEHLEKIRIFPKYGGCGSKIESATPISILNL